LEQLSTGADPSLAELRALAEALKVGLTDLAPLPKESRQAGVLFRGVTRNKQALEDTLVDTLSRKMGYSLELLQPERAEQPWWTTAFATVPTDNPEALAFRFRQVFCSGDQVSPLLSLPQVLLTQLQMMLFVINTPHIDGASAYFSGVPFIFVAARFGPRMLFTCAHELGHMLAHHDPRADFATIDAPEDIEPRRSPSRTESFAHTFASALLLPRAGVGIVLKKVRELAKVPADSAVGDAELLYVARIFGVSFEVAARRCEDLQLLPRGSAASLNKRIQEEYDSAEKRADALGLPPRAPVMFPSLPQTLLDAAVDKIRVGELSVGRASMMLGVSIAELFGANAPRLQ
jgi:Zn-dependent peptidase ImmA (M78 family)